MIDDISPTIPNSWQEAQSPPAAEQPLCGPSLASGFPRRSVTSWPVTELGRAMGDSWCSSKVRICTWRTRTDLPPIFWLVTRFPLLASFSPDGSRIRFSLQDQANTNSLWEVRADGSNLRPSCRDGTAPPNERYGRWSEDGRYFSSKATTSRAATFLPSRNPPAFSAELPHAGPTDNGSSLVLPAMPDFSGREAICAGHTAAQ